MNKSPLNSWDYTLDFWEVNPLFGAITPFSLLKKQRNGALAMWATALFSDPADSNPLYRMNPTERLSHIKKNVYPTFSTVRHAKFIKAYPEVALTKKQRAHKVLLDKLDERALLLTDTPYTLENAEKLDKIMANTEKLYATISRIEEEMVKEASSRGIKSKLSLMDKL